MIKSIFIFGLVNATFLAFGSLFVLDGIFFGVLANNGHLGDALFDLFFLPVLISGFIQFVLGLLIFGLYFFFKRRGRVFSRIETLSFRVNFCVFLLAIIGFLLLYAVASSMSAY